MSRNSLPGNALQISPIAAWLPAARERLFQPFFRVIRIEVCQQYELLVIYFYIGVAMSWIKMTVAGVALCAGASVASAQNAPAAGAPPTAGPQGGPQGGQRGGRGMAALLEGITLTEAQQAQFDAIREKYKAERQKLMPNGMGGGPPDEGMRAKMKEMMDKQNLELRAVLTADQQKVFDANIENRKKRK